MLGLEEKGWSDIRRPVEGGIYGAFPVVDIVFHCVYLGAEQRTKDVEGVYVKSKILLRLTFRISRGHQIAVAECQCQALARIAAWSPCSELTSS